MQTDLLQSRIDDISDRIRMVREARGHTLVQLGHLSGVAPSTIQKIENRQMTPSIAILLKISAGLGVDPPELIAPVDPPPLEIVVQRAGQHPRIKASTNLEYEKLSVDLADAELEFWRVKVAAGHSTEIVPPWRLDEHIFVCEEGRIDLVLDEKAVSLNEGDSIHLRSKVISRVSNPGDSPACYLFSGKYPHGLRKDLVAGVR